LKAGPIPLWTVFYNCSTKLNTSNGNAKQINSGGGWGEGLAWEGAVEKCILGGIDDASSTGASLINVAAKSWT